MSLLSFIFAELNTTQSQIRKTMLDWCPKQFKSQPSKSFFLFFFLSMYHNFPSFLLSTFAFILFIFLSFLFFYFILLLLSFSYSIFPSFKLLRLFLPLTGAIIPPSLFFLHFFITIIYSFHQYFINS